MPYPPTNSFYCFRSLGMLYLIQNPANLRSTSPLSTPPVAPSLLPLPNSPEPNPELRTYSTSSSARHRTFPITPRRSTPSHHRRPPHRPPRLKHPTRIVASIQVLSSSQVARRGASRLGRLRGEGSASTSASANSDVRRTTKVSLSQVSFRVRTFEDLRECRGRFCKRCECHMVCMRESSPIWDA